MRILYHHRTRATDAQKIHICEIIGAFRELGHEVREVALVPVEAHSADNPARDAGESAWKLWVKRVPFAYELVQLGYNAVGLPMLVWRMLAWRPDFIYERYSLFNFAGVMAARLLGVPCVLEVNSPFALEQARDADIRAVGLAKWSERAILRRATRVIVVTHVLKRIVAEQGIDERAIEVMHNGVNPARFTPRPADAALRAQLGLDGRVVFGFVGWFRNWHGLDFLMEAFSRSELTADQAALVLVGDGPGMADVRNYVERCALGDRVKLVGLLPHAEVPRYVALFDAALQPAANEYCCPMKIIEYLAVGKPVIAPRQPNIEELVEDGREALLFGDGKVNELAACLRRVVEDATLRARLSAAAFARQAGGTLRWTHNAARVVELIAPRQNGF